MTSPYADEIAANLERAEQSIQAARHLASGGYYDFEQTNWVSSGHRSSGKCWTG